MPTNGLVSDGPDAAGRSSDTAPGASPPRSLAAELVIGWLLNAAYAVLLAVLTPWLLYRRLVLGKDREGFREKCLGDLRPSHPSRPVLWLHAVSVGEVLQLKGLVSQLAARWPGVELVVTTTTQTGHAVALAQLPDCSIRYFPMDWTWAVDRALAQLQPAGLILVELELWPNLLLAARRRGVPVAIVNGRLSERSARGYRWVRTLLGWVWPAFGRIAVQNEEYARRFLGLGATSDQVVVAGNLKCDRVQVDRGQPLVAELRATFELPAAAPVLIAGSTQAPEEAIAISAWRAARRQFPDLRLILVPRHQERFEEVARLVNESGARLIRRSKRKLEQLLRDQLPIPTALDQPAVAPDPDTTEPPIGLLDTLGELSACWGLATIAFVGGSLTRRGGQNMMEPAAYGAAVLFGPNTQNFRDVTALLLEGRAAIVVQNAAELTATVLKLLGDPVERTRLGETARDLVLAQRGATDRTVALLGALYDERLRTTSRGQQTRAA